MSKEYKESFYGLEYDNKSLKSENEILKSRIKGVATERDEILKVLEKAISLVETISCSGKCTRCDKCDLFNNRVLKVWGIKR